MGNINAYGNIKSIKRSLLLICMLLTIVYLQYSYSNSNDPNSIDQYYYEIYLSPKQSQNQEKICKLPVLKLEGHDNVEKYVECKMKSEWGYLKKSHWYFNKTVVNKLKDIICTYRSINHIDDFTLNYSKYSLLIDGQFIPNEVIEVNCTANSLLLSYDNLHVQLINKINLKIQNNEKENSKQCKPINILLISYDSISRVSWFLRLPKTTKYLLKTMKSTILYGQNIVGDGTPACMIPILTGKTEEELPSTLKSDPNGQYVDQAYPFIWNDMHKKGYMSFHMEDWPQVSAFTYRLRGFSNKTAHHYMRSYQLGLWQRVSDSYFALKDDLCIGSIKRSKRSLNLISEFMNLYEKQSNYIAIMHYIENSHDGNKDANYLDQDVYDFLKSNFENGLFDNTVVMLYSDHGSRYAHERWSRQGDLEERLPFFSIYLPQSFKNAYPKKYSNLLKNSQQLTTPFDIHQTLRDLSCTKNENINEIRSISLLDKIPEDRTCESIGLSVHYCVCEQNWKNLDIIDEITIKAASFTIKYINNFMSNVLDLCYKLSIKEINYSKFLKLKDKSYAKLDFYTRPNNAHYQVLLSYEENKGFAISSTDSISRTNAYGNQPNCLLHITPKRNITIDLRKFCFCRNLKKRKHI